MSGELEDTGKQRRTVVDIDPLVREALAELRRVCRRYPEGLDRSIEEQLVQGGWTEVVVKGALYLEESLRAALERRGETPASGLFEMIEMVRVRGFASPLVASSAHGLRVTRNEVVHVPPAHLRPRELAAYLLALAAIVEWRWAPLLTARQAVEWEEEGIPRRREIGEGKTLVIGREPSVCDIVVAGDTRVSRQHASIELSAVSLIVRDLGSQNGTFVNGVKMKELEIPLGLGATLEVGSRRFAIGPVASDVPRAFIAAETELPGQVFG